MPGDEILRCKAVVLIRKRCQERELAAVPGAASDEVPVATVVTGAVAHRQVKLVGSNSMSNMRERSLNTEVRVFEKDTCKVVRAEQDVLISPADELLHGLAVRGGWAE